MPLLLSHCLYSRVWRLLSCFSAWRLVLVLQLGVQFRGGWSLYLVDLQRVFGGWSVDGDMVWWLNFEPWLSGHLDFWTLVFWTLVFWTLDFWISGHWISGLWTSGLWLCRSLFLLFLYVPLL